MPTPLTTAVRGYEAALMRLCEATPGGLAEHAGGVRLLFSRALIPTLNVVTVLDGDWSASELTARTRQGATLDLPWSVLLRVGRDGTNADRLEEVAGIASAAGLSKRSEMPFMTCSPGTFRPRGAASAPGPAPAPAVVDVTTDWREYTDVLADGFEAPAMVFGSLMAGDVLRTDGFTGYLARQAGEPVGTGFGVHSGTSLGVFNIAVPPAHRSAGIGRAVTERVVDDGFRAGADVAYLHATTAGRPLYASMGFEHVETWVAFV